jgi:hypothetical protein
VINEKNHTSIKLHIIYISSNNVRHPLTKTFNTVETFRRILLLPSSDELEAEFFLPDIPEQNNLKLKAFATFTAVCTKHMVAGMWIFIVCRLSEGRN